MVLPLEARLRLAAPLRQISDAGRLRRELHTLPIAQSAWKFHTAEIAGLVEDFAEAVLLKITDFRGTLVQVNDILRRRERLVAKLTLLEPFLPFDPERASELLQVTAEALERSAKGIEDGLGDFRSDKRFAAIADWWRHSEGQSSDTDIWRIALAMDQAPVDEMREFRSDWVLQKYAYRNSELLELLIPHLRSLGVGGVTDPLAGVSIVGWILNCDDAATAYGAMREFLRVSSATAPVVLRATQDHLERSEPAIRKSREMIGRSIKIATSHSELPEVRALALVDAYKRVVEGPFRQYCWAIFCMKAGDHSLPPTLGEFTRRLQAGGGLLASTSVAVVIADIRNSEAHETLSWDGFAEEFVTEHGRVSPSAVSRALILGDTFARGAEAGFVALRSLELTGQSPYLPESSERGRMEPWRRVQGFFGTNRLRLTAVHLNSRQAFLRVARLAVTDLNPCFQALVLARRLIPEIKVFSVAVASSPTALLEVSAAAIDAARPAWEEAVTALTRIPLATFLPINLEARSRLESPSLAERSASWIAVDDAVGAFDGSPLVWTIDDVTLMDRRLCVIELAIEGSMRLLGRESLRLRTVADALGEMRAMLFVSDDPRRSLEESTTMLRLRTQWEGWGPVPRHPSISDEDAPDASELQPTLLDPLGPSWYRTL